MEHDALIVREKSGVLSCSKVNAVRVNNRLKNHGNSVARTPRRNNLTLLSPHGRVANIMIIGVRYIPLRRYL